MNACELCGRQADFWDLEQGDICGVCLTVLLANRKRAQDDAEEEEWRRSWAD